jgi:phage terminase large subunit-like protein
MAPRWKPRSEAERKAADRVFRFIETRLTHTRGQYAGQPFELLPWQRDEVIGPVFGSLRKDGRRQYRQAYIEVGKKQGKSELAAAIALAGLVADGEPGAEIYSSAIDKEQAAIVFERAAMMVERDPVLSRMIKVIPTSHRMVVTQGPQTGSIYRAIPGDAAGADGVNPSMLIFDEIHRYPNRELYDTLVRSTAARRQPLIIGITTAGYERETLCWSLHEYARQVLEGVIDDPEFLAVMHAADPELDFRDERAWRQANPSLGRTVSLDYYRAEARKAEADPTLENSFRRFHLNQWVAQEVRWMPMHLYDASAGEVDAVKLAGRPCFGGFDLSNVGDVTAFALIFPPIDEKDFGAYKVLPFFWLPEDGLAERVRRDRVPYDRWARDGLINLTPGNVIDFESIWRDVRTLAQRYAIVDIAVDPYQAWQLMQQLSAIGLNVFPLRQGFFQLGPPTAEIMRLVKTGRLHHGGNPVLRWMFDNTVVEQDRDGGLWKPSKRKSTQRIDGVLACVMGLDRATRHEPPDDDRILVYEDRVQIGPRI